MIGYCNKPGCLFMAILEGGFVLFGYLQEMTWELAYTGEGC